MSIDLSGMSTADLVALSKQIEARKELVQKESLQNAYAEMQKVSSKFGVALDDVISLHNGKGKKTKSPAKYINPEDPTQTWTGRGRKPEWVHAALAAGQSLDDLMI
ncbi:putative regulatory protein, H-NS histone family (plasmid) [Phaeobacter piscinae]|uniref:Regulatory protein, H-NS histone family n=1 Tax=Phaeobacter piscinae TaxID=1580596 RepID=A0ABM6PJ35_9RHOB|nr:H-NS histone family protein [Phaeobacter piscinae]ATG37841.1 putative regulatory protein, H-NS histone family [Phaeobacter piscinae]AUQ88362.1 putative regulatory protein, H-NS histone family [Phaeobacter piscinae]AUR26245.1 putative regulatory protein, H-NS histone family [Phaeobacter piscinae]